MKIAILMMTLAGLSAPAYADGLDAKDLGKVGVTAIEGFVKNYVEHAKHIVKYTVTKTNDPNVANVAIVIKHGAHDMTFAYRCEKFDDGALECEAQD